MSTPRKSQWDTVHLVLPHKVDLILKRVRRPKDGFRMGSRGYPYDEEPEHQVVIPQDYYLGMDAVTQAQYRAVASLPRAGIADSDPSDFKGEDRPVENVSWHDANLFCAALTQWVAGRRLPKGFHLFCLPTEAEWEHACRAGTDTEYHSGDGEAALGEAGWYSGNSERRTHDVGEAMPLGFSRQVNGFGLRHMHGNILEWCHDRYEEDAYRNRVDGEVDPGQQERDAEWRDWWTRNRRARDGAGNLTEDDRLRVVRGGSWGFSAWRCRSALRFGWGPGERDSDQGFRVCLVPGPAQLQALFKQLHGAQARRAPRVGAEAKRAETEGAGCAGAEIGPTSAQAAREAGSIFSQKKSGKGVPGPVSMSRRKSAAPKPRRS